MDKQNSKALVIAFYLSKFDEIAYEKLNLGNNTQTHEKIGEILSVNPNSIKNMRDEFDPYHPNERVGWYQRPLRPSRQKVFNSFTDLSELALREIVIDILNQESDDNLEPVIEYIADSSETDEDLDEDVIYSSRGITGDKAERFFIENWQMYYPSFSNLINRTKDGCGYDFELGSDDNLEKFVEVKGLKSATGGVLLTSKEWDVAIDEEEKFDLFIVFDVNDNPTAKIISNPAKRLFPRKQVQTVVQVNWTLTSKQITDA